MEELKVVLLGFVQGMTEFFPVSSSGHLVIFGEYLRCDNAGLTLTLSLHLGTLFAVIIFLRQELKKILRGLFRGGGWLVDPGKRLILLIIIGSIPATIVGLTARDFIAGLFEENVQFVAVMLVFNGLVLLIADHFSSVERRENIGIGKALLIGLSQAIAIIPGISRSGITIATGMLAGIPGEVAASYSFLLSIPAVLGAGIIELISAKDLTDRMIFTYLLGGAVAFFSGLLCLGLLFLTIRKRRLKFFAAYCILLGIGVLALG